MTHAEATEKCARLNRESKDNTSWMAHRKDDESWEVVRIAGMTSADMGTATEVRADERPVTPGDPRSGPERDAGTGIYL